MNVLTVGLSHRTAPVDLLERTAVAPDDVDKLLGELLDTTNVAEAVLVSTCNRVEIYAIVETFHGGLDDATGVLSRYSGVPVHELTDHLYVCYADAAVEHLFSVAAGLDSMVVGETQILGQLRQAYNQADNLGTVGRVLHDLCQQALRVGKRVHAETEIDAAGASVVSEALGDAEGLLGDLTDHRALLVGAGSMGGLAAAQLKRRGIGEIVIANRTRTNGERLVESVHADGVDGRTASLTDLPVELTTADLVVACTGAVGSVISSADVSEALARRRSARPLVLCDLGLPRDTAPQVAELPGVVVVDLATLQQRLGEREGGGEAERAAAVVSQEVQNYQAAQRSAEVTPTVTALRKRAAEVADAELMRLDSRLPELGDDVREELSRTVRRVVDKLLHAPTVRVKQLAATPGGSDYAEALRELFELEPATAAAVTRSRAAEGQSPRPRDGSVVHPGVLRNPGGASADPGTTSTSGQDGDDR